MEKLNRAFTPHRPIDLPEFLSGRIDVLYRANDAANTSGLHILLFGDRGTGKTSVAHVLAANVQEPERPDGRRALLATCATSDDYSSIWRKVFQEIWLAERQLGFGQAESARITGRLAVDSPVGSPNDVRIILESLANPYFVIIDEFDRVQRDNDARRLMADTIKLFSDTNVRSTVMIVGVAESITDLIGEHPSISRNICEILVQPMTPDELSEIVQRGFGLAGMTYEPGLDRRIAEHSQGYPHYTHLLGLWSGRRAAENGDLHVLDAHLDAAIPAALENATGGVQQAYENAVASSQPNNLFREVLLACAKARKDPLGRFRAMDLRTPLYEVTGRQLEMGAYQSHLAKFCEPERGPILKKTGRRRHFRWQFVDPQMIPYVLLKGIPDRAQE